MERLAVKKREDLTYLVAKLRESNSPVILDWNKEFNPTLAYRTSIEMRDVQIEFWGRYWEDSYHLYSLFCEEFGWTLDIKNFIWLSKNTQIINRALYGNNLFNRYIEENGAYRELNEFIKNHSLVEMKEGYLEVLYSEKYMDMFKYLGMEFMDEKYLYRSNMGYYLPVEIKIKYGNGLDWVKDSGEFKRRELEIIHTPRVEVHCLEKGTFYKLAKGLYKEFGYSDLIVEWVDQPYKEDYEVMIGNVRVKVVDNWKKNNKKYVKAVGQLKSISKKKLDAFKMKELLEHSEWTDYGIHLEESYYNRLSIPKKKITGQHKEVDRGVYSTGDTLLGRREPIVVKLEDFTIHTPYELVQEGKYYEPLIPLTRPDLSKESKSYLDEDVKIVLGYNKKEEEVNIEEVMYRGVSKGDEDTKYSVHEYPSVEVKDSDLPEIESSTQKGVQKVLMGGIEDIENIPYVESYHQDKDEIRVYYKGGDSLMVKGVGGRATNLRERVVFKDSIGVDYKGFTSDLVEMLMSLATDELVYYDFEELKGDVRVRIKEIVDLWLEAIITGEVESLISLIEDFKEEVVIEEEGLDIFSEFEFFT